MKSKKVRFSNSAGHQLSAIIELPDTREPLVFAIFAHCFTCNKNFTAIRNISKSLTDNNIAVFRFDFTGLGESEGDFANTNFSSNIEDVLAAASYLASEYKAPEILVGHSLGGAAAIFAAARLKQVKAVATVGAPFSPGHVAGLFKKNLEQIMAEGIAEVSIGGRPFRIKKQFLEDIEEAKHQQTIRELKKPILILHSPQDKIVSIENAAMIYQSAMHPKSFISLDGADHLLSREEDSLYAGHMIATWAKRYI